MARGIHKLTARTVSTAKAQGRHSDGGGLYLVITKTGSKQWVLVVTPG